MSAQVAPPPYTPEEVKSTAGAKYTKEYVSVNGYNASMVQLLGQTIETLEKSLTVEQVERMERDPVFAKIKQILVTGTLAEDPQFAPGATEDEADSEAEFKKYEEVQHLCEYILGNLRTPTRTVSKQMLDGLGSGYKVGEILWDYVDYPVKSRRIGTSKAQTPSTKKYLLPVDIKSKPRGAVRFVVDTFWNVLGCVATMAPNKWGFGTGSTAQGNVAVGDIIPRDKFAVFTWDMRDCDPRGNSAWLPGFTMWSLRQHLPAEFLRYLLQCAVPGLVGKLPENVEPFDFAYESDGVTPKLDEKGQPVEEPAVVSFHKIIAGYRNSSGAVIPHDAELTALKSGEANGDVFPNAMKATGKEIEESVLLQSLAQSEGDHQSKSASSTVEGRLFAQFFWVKWLVAQMYLKDVCEPAVRKNLGDWAVAYMPMLSLGDSEPRDWVLYLTSLADAYFKGLLDDTQRPEIMAWMALPKPGPSRAEMMASVDPNTGAPQPPNNQRPDKQKGQDNRNEGNGTPKKENQNANARPGAFNALGHPGRRFAQYARTVLRRRRS